MLNGTLHGKGTWKDNYGDYECTFLDDTRIGVLICRTPKGMVLIFEMCGKNHGKGTVHLSNGTINNQVYRHGKIIA